MADEEKEQPADMKTKAFNRLLQEGANTILLFLIFGVMSYGGYMDVTIWRPAEKKALVEDMAKVYDLKDKAHATDRAALITAQTTEREAFAAERKFLKESYSSDLQLVREIAELKARRIGDIPLVPDDAKKTAGS